MLLAVLFYVLSPVHMVLTAPIQNLTALQTEIAPAWVDAPRSRGTGELLYSCIFTLGLCVWTAIHMNVAGHDDTAMTIWLRKIKWVGVAIIAPEFVLCSAFQQWILANKFQKELNEQATKHHNNQKSMSSQHTAVRSFSMAYAFYAVMGGFCANVKSMHNTLTKVTVTTEGLWYLAEYGHFIEMSDASIGDKSKAGLLAKGLSCVQVLWLAGQAIERKAAGYPITLLEVHILVHVGCALIMYTLWLSKPFQVYEPTVVNTEESEDIQNCIAWMLILSDDTNLIRQRYDKEDSWYQRPLEPKSLGWYGHVLYCFKDIPHQSDPFSNGKLDWASRILLDSPQDKAIEIVTYLREINPDNGRAYSAFPVRTVVDFWPRNTGDEPLPTCSLVDGQALASGIGLTCAWPCLCPEDPTRHYCYTSLHSNMRRNLPSKSLRLSRKDITRFNHAANHIKILDYECEYSNSYRQQNHFLLNRTEENGETHQKLTADNVSKLPLPISLDDIDITSCYNELRSSRERNRRLVIREKNFRYLSMRIHDKHNRLRDNFNWKIFLIPTINFVPAAYGAIHLSALTILFPTEIERLLWKAASCILIATAGGTFLSSILWLFLISSNREIAIYISFLIFNIRFTISSLLHGQPVPGLEELPGIWGKLIKLIYYTAAILCLVLGTVLALLYATARIYIVVESFISLRHVPIGVYQTPSLNIMDYVPHL